MLEYGPLGWPWKTINPAGFSRLTELGAPDGESSDVECSPVQPANTVANIRAAPNATLGSTFLIRDLPSMVGGPGSARTITPCGRRRVLLACGLLLLAWTHEDRLALTRCRSKVLAVGDLGA